MVPLLAGIARNAEPVAVLTSARVVALAESSLLEFPELRGLRWLAIEDAPAGLAGEWDDVRLDRGTPALIQYTSGSTSFPKGVLVSHGNLLHNSALIHRSFGYTAESRGVIWLPPHHDMGLIGGILQPLYGGFPVTLMSPAAFLLRPARWLQAISRTRATTSGGPNFAYDLATRKITPDQRVALDLSSWKVAFNGAEPVAIETMERFAEAFEPCGFRREAFHPCYGLAEATLFVSGAKQRRAGPPASDRPAEPKRTEASVDARAGSGRVPDGQRVIIVDPRRRVEAPPGEIGEIWISGPSVACGYWNLPEESQKTFGAYLADRLEGPFLRTGDLGFLRGNDLVVTGRLKDLIIIGGRNHYPQDIERTVAQTHPALRYDCCAAFSVQGNPGERLVIAAEIDHRLFVSIRSQGPAQNQRPELLQAIRTVVAEHHDLRVDQVLLVKTGSLPRTTSGKLQRHACRAQFLDGTLEALNGAEL
jgi:acyl-CoA synthetase (AMP-forming)/AMP-acid ligase II